MSTQAALAPKPLTFALLRLLSDGEFHSGEQLAQQLEVSRASIHNALADVEDYGLVLYAVRGRGYCLAEPLQWLDAEKISAELRTPGVFQLEICDVGLSSNTQLLQRAALGASSGSVLALEWQGAGRGRLGRSWHSGLGTALTFSLLWRFDSGLAAMSGLSLAVGVALMRVLNQLEVSGVSLKWPNDVLVQTSAGNKGKLAGILIEAQGDTMGPSAAVIGIGINLLPPLHRELIDQPVVCLAQLMPRLPHRNQLLAMLLQALADMLEQFTSHGFAALRGEWERYHRYQDQLVKLLLPDGKQQSGKVIGVSDEGALRLQTQQGERIFHAGEISLREA